MEAGEVPEDPQLLVVELDLGRSTALGSTSGSMSEAVASQATAATYAAKSRAASIDPGRGWRLRVEAEVAVGQHLLQQRAPARVAVHHRPPQRVALAGHLAGAHGVEAAAGLHDEVALAPRDASAGTSPRTSSVSVARPARALSRSTSSGTGSISRTGHGPTRVMPCSRRIQRVHGWLQCSDHAMSSSRGRRRATPGPARPRSAQVVGDGVRPLEVAVPEAVAVREVAVERAAARPPARRRDARAPRRRSRSRCAGRPPRARTTPAGRRRRTTRRAPPGRR